MVFDVMHARRARRAAFEDKVFGADAEGQRASGKRFTPLQRQALAGGGDGRALFELPVHQVHGR
ncbi:hypothetical protein D3C86_2165860 [compost metagenome]